MRGNDFAKLLWIYIFPLLGFPLLNEKEGLIWVSLLYVIIALILFLPSGIFAVTDFSTGQKSRLLISLFLVCSITWTYERTRNIVQSNLEQVNKDLKQTQHQLVQTAKFASIGELAAGVAHELNQPLMVIRGNTQLILRSMNKNRYDINCLEQDLNIVLNNSKRMMLIIDHLRTFSRQSEHNFTAVDINKIINNCLLMVGEQIRLHNIEMIMDLAFDIPQIKGKSNQLEQVFLNLLTNARDAINQRRENDLNCPGIIEIHTRVVKTPVGDEIQIQIKDTGRGIAKKSIENIFDPFFTTKEVGKGTGLGLSISYGIIKDHEGEINVTETGADGTTFEVKIPVIRA